MAVFKADRRNFALFGLFLVLGGSVCVHAVVDVALVEFVLAGKSTTTSLEVAGAMLDTAEMEITQMYGMNLNFSRVRIYDKNVTTCELMDQKATFWATRYFYREAQGNPVMGMFGPGDYFF